MIKTEKYLPFQKVVLLLLLPPTDTIRIQDIFVCLRIVFISTTSMWMEPEPLRTGLTMRPCRVGSVGNVYTETDSITLNLDTSTPTVVLTSSDSDFRVTKADTVTITAVFSKQMS